MCRKPPEDPKGLPGLVGGRGLVPRTGMPVGLRIRAKTFRVLALSLLSPGMEW